MGVLDLNSLPALFYIETFLWGRIECRPKNPEGSCSKQVPGFRKGSASGRMGDMTGDRALDCQSIQHNNVSIRNAEMMTSLSIKPRERSEKSRKGKKIEREQFIFFLVVGHDDDVLHHPNLRFSP